ncbi:MAG: pyrroline-5-carboxylate reductase [Ruminococcaceae bacterium]|nr:pyrroline-5-carboxylate reductase [Oscillospiraceae bacterium]
MRKIKIGFIGCGNMGGAIASRVAQYEDAIVFVSDYSVEKAEKFASEIGAATSDNFEIAKKCDYIFLAVKPQVMAGVLTEIKETLASRKDRFVLVSMAAGITIEKIKSLCGDFSVIRIMPNTPVAVGCGMIVYATSADVSKEETENFAAFMKDCGRLDPIDEGKIDAATAIHGCGPAFVYMFANAMADAGVANGLTRDQAMEYSAQTLLGAAKMILESGKHPMELKDNVCSPGGSTIAGVMALDGYAFNAGVEAAVNAAYERTKELGK